MLRDKKAQEFLKLWGPKSMPTAKVVHGYVRPGRYPAFGLMAWVESRNGWPVVGIQLAILRPELDRQTGGMVMSLPLLPKTERQVCGFLQELGWDGRVWPHRDHGWPEGTPDEASLLGLLKSAKLGATLTFPSVPDKGIPTVQVYVERSKGTFHIAPFEEETASTEIKHLDALRALAADPSPFKSDWT